MSILSPNAEEIEALALREEPKEIQFSESPDRTALETLELRILRHRPDYEVRFYGFYREKCDLRMLRHIPSGRQLPPGRGRRYRTNRAPEASRQFENWS